MKGSHSASVMSKTLRRARHRLKSNLPSVNFNADTWNLSEIHRSTGRRSVDFARISNFQLRNLCKAHIVEGRVFRGIGLAAILSRRDAYRFLSDVIHDRSPFSLSDTDFDYAHRVLRDTPNRGNRLVSELRRVGIWLSSELGIRITFAPKIERSATHGFHGTDEGRSAKLVPDEVISDVLALRHRTDLDERDRMFLCLFAIAVATGFRIHELVTLPADCVILDENSLKLRNFSTKGGKIAPRPIAPEFVEMVQTCISEVHAMTERPRLVAATLDKGRPVDWRRFFSECDDVDIETGLKAAAATWISHPNRRMLDTRMAYSRHLDRWFEIEDAIEKYKSKLGVAKALGISRSLVYDLLDQTAAAREGRIFARHGREVSPQAFETDPRVYSLGALCLDTDLPMSLIAKSSIARQIVSETIDAQLSGLPFDAPPRSKSVLRRFRREPLVALRSQRTKQVMLYARDALCVVFVGQLNTEVTRQDLVRMVTTNMINFWLRGMPRSWGTRSREDSLFRRFNIIDPRTKQPASFTVHDLRHWLTTAYSEGGLSKDQMAVVFNRNSPGANSTYIQTPSKVRNENLRQTMADGQVLGHHSETHARLAREDPEQAAHYLESATKIYTPMPHGICTLNLALEPCPHSLRCFSCNREGKGAGKACEDLVVDPTDQGQRDEIRRINANAASMVSLLEDEEMTDAPQYLHFREVVSSTADLLAQMDRK